MCLRFFSLSCKILLITAAGIKAKAIETTKTRKIPLAVADLFFNVSVTGKGEVIHSNFKLGFPLTVFKIA